MPLVSAPNFPAADEVYDRRTNSVYSLSTGNRLWQGAVAPSANTEIGAAAGAMVVYESGHQVVVTTAP